MLLNVREVNKSTELSTSKTKKAGSGESFASYLQDVNKSESRVVSSPSGIAGADAIFAAQMINDEEGRERRRQAVKGTAFMHAADFLRRRRLWTE